MAATIQQAAAQQQQQKQQEQHPDLSLHAGRSGVSTPAGVAASADSSHPPLSFFRNDILACSSVWCHPSLRPPSQAAHCTPHVARHLQSLGVFQHSTHPLLLPCAQQIVHDDDEFTAALALDD